MFKIYCRQYILNYGRFIKPVLIFIDPAENIKHDFYTVNNTEQESEEEVDWD
jgi:hypothetical protein